jgi:hypothetical protein
MNQSPLGFTATRDLRHAYRVEHVVEVLVEQIERAARAHHPGGGRATVSVWYDVDAQCWIATVSTDDGRVLRSACGPTELDACHTLARSLRCSPPAA